MFTGQKTILAYAHEDAVCDKFSQINHGAAQATVAQLFCTINVRGLLRFVQQLEHPLRRRQGAEDLIHDVGNAISPPLVLCMIFTLPVSILFTRYMGRKTRPLYAKRSKAYGEMNGFAEEMFTGQKTILAYSIY